MCFRSTGAWQRAALKNEMPARVALASRADDSSRRISARNHHDTPPAASGTSRRRGAHPTSHWRRRGQRDLIQAALTGRRNISETPVSGLTAGSVSQDPPTRSIPGRADTH